MLIEQNGLKAQDIVELRGVECKAFTEIKTPTNNNKRSIILDTNYWNPVHFATFYKQQKVLEFFHEIFGSTLDIRYAMKFNNNDLLSYEGAILRKTDQGKLLQQKTLNELIKDKFHLYGFLLAILTADVSIF